MLNTRKRYVGGFTLIELLIVIAIIAILALIAIPNFLEAQTRSKCARVYADLRTLRLGLEAYYVDWNCYPSDKVNVEINSWLQLTTPVAYLTSVPSDTFCEKKYWLDRSQLECARMKAFVYGADTDPATNWPNNIFDPVGIYYYIFSAGPDIKMEPPAHAAIAGGPGACANWLYDPTNGTISYGDIMMTNRAFYNIK
ncbi:MAG: prepilin-type N-terminal cleavage/methylation domain-containing protein [Candidatus Sumerlaeota bacterium]|nr:prepilin-type N-terminal cleavage/methylation domain-containing protein [Candidatus Sumerlaeota bacterium]